MVPEAPPRQTEHGLLPTREEGWFILNARDACWFWDGRSAGSEFEGEYEFQQVGIFLRVLTPGVPMGLYHRETDQEAFLVLSGEALLVVEGEERPLRQWDFVHCPPKTEHVIVGAGDRPCVVLCMSSRENQQFGPYGEYTANEVARRYGASPEQDVQDSDVAGAHLPERGYTRYREDWLPES